MGTPPALPARHWCCSSAALPSLHSRAAFGVPWSQLLQQIQDELCALQQGQPLVGSGTKQQGINLLVCFQNCFFFIGAPTKRAENPSSLPDHNSSFCKLSRAL